MKKTNNNKVNKQNKRFLVFILCFLSIFILTIPAYYGIEYFRNKVHPLTEEINKLEEKGTEVIKIKGSDFKEFSFTLICKDFDVTKNYRAIYTANIDISDLQISNIKMQVSLNANWIKFDKKSTEISLKNGNYNQTTSVYDLKPLVIKENKLLPLPKVSTYVLLTYDRGPTSNRKSYAYLLEYEYGSYKIDKGGYPA